MITMTSIQQLLQREPAATTGNTATTSGFAETYAQAASQAAKPEPSEQAATAASERSVDSSPQDQNRPKWLALFNNQAPIVNSQQTSAPIAAAAPLLTEQPIDPAQTDAAPTLQAIAVAAPQLAATAANKPVSGQPTMTEQPIATSSTDKAPVDLKTAVSNPAQSAPVATAKPGAEQPVVKEHANQQSNAATQKLTAEQVTSATTIATHSSPPNSAAQAAQLAARSLAKASDAELKQTNQAALKPNQPGQIEQVVSTASTAPQVAALKATAQQPAIAAQTGQSNNTQHPSPAPVQPTPQRADLAFELSDTPELMRQNATAATPQEQLLAAQITKEAMSAEAAKFSLGEATNPNSLNATQSTAQLGTASPQSVVAETAGTAPQLTAKLGTQAWQQQLSQQVSQLVLQSDQSVALRLHPAELGSLMVQMRVEDGAAQLSIQSGNAQVRQALEQALPQLRDALANQGIDLGQTHVGSQSARDFSQQSERHAAEQSESTSDSLIAADNTDNDSSPASPSSVPAGTLDLYA
ncbi:MAG TPA: flagellar hook-length control protein FliK [Pseudidiomarina sp.]|nr:flagellar hook-length control protein FliK [Pseudidiomarina sp.]